MSEKEKMKIARIIYRIFKISFFVCLFFFCIFTIMSFMGGSSDTLKQGLEEYISEASGYETQIGTLNKMSFFPFIGFNFEDLVLVRDIEGDEFNQKEVAVIVDKADFAVGFWDVALSSGKFSSFYVEETVAAPGVFLGSPLHISKLMIVPETEGEKAFLHLTGHVDTEDLEARMTLETYGKGQKKKYGFGKSSEFSLRIGRAKAEGVWDKQKTGPVIRDLRVFLDDKEVMTSELKIIRDTEEGVNLQGQVKFSGHGSTFEPDVEILVHEGSLSSSGVLNSTDFSAEDFDKSSDLGAFVEYIYPVLFGQEGFSIPARKLDLDVAADQEKNIHLEDVLVFINPGTDQALSFKVEPLPEIK